MMGDTHRWLAGTWWLGGVLAANSAGAGIRPSVALAGAVIAHVFGAGRLSPDADLTWLQHLGHRQATHRPDTTAVYLTAATMAVWVAVLLFAPAESRPLHWLVWAPVTGWWSHLAGDMVYGRCPVGRRSGGRLVRVLPARLIRRGGGWQAWWIGVGLDTDGLSERGKLYVEQVPPWLRPLLCLSARNRRALSGPVRTRSGLRATVRVLPFAPATCLLSATTILLAVAVVVQWVA